MSVIFDGISGTSTLQGNRTQNGKQVQILWKILKMSENILQKGFILTSLVVLVFSTIILSIFIKENHSVVLIEVLAVTLLLLYSLENQKVEWKRPLKLLNIMDSSFSAIISWVVIPILLPKIFVQVVVMNVLLIGITFTSIPILISAMITLFIDAVIRRYRKWIFFLIVSLFSAILSSVLLVIGYLILIPLLKELPFLVKLIIGGSSGAFLFFVLFFSVVVEWLFLVIVSIRNQTIKYFFQVTKMNILEGGEFLFKKENTSLMNMNVSEQIENESEQIENESEQIENESEERENKLLEKLKTSLKIFGELSKAVFSLQNVFVKNANSDILLIIQSLRIINDDDLFQQVKEYNNNLVNLD